MLYPQMYNLHADPKEHTFGRIVGGDLAAEHEFPIIAAVNFQIGFAGYFCGGTIVAVDTIMTAAHCVSRADSITVIVGTNHWRSPQTTGGQSLAAYNWQPHPQYSDSIIGYYDIGYIKIRGLQLNANVALADRSTAEPAAETRVSCYSLNT